MPDRKTCTWLKEIGLPQTGAGMYWDTEGSLGRTSYYDEFDDTPTNVVLKIPSPCDLEAFAIELEWKRKIISGDYEDEFRLICTSINKRDKKLYAVSIIRDHGTWGPPAPDTPYAIKITVYGDTKSDALVSLIRKLVELDK